MKCLEVFNLYPETCCTLRLSKLRFPPRVSDFITSLIWGAPIIINLIFWCFLSSCDSLYLTKEIKHPTLLFFPSTTQLCPYSSQEHAERELGGRWLSRKVGAVDFIKKRTTGNCDSGFKTFSFFNIHVKKKKTTTNKTNKQKKINPAGKKKAENLSLY